MYLPLLTFLALPALRALAAPATLDERACNDCLPGYTLKRYHVVYDNIHADDGTPITLLKGLDYKGFYVSGRDNGFNPYPESGPNSTPKFAVADHARDQSADALPSLTVKDLGAGQSLFKLNSFYWAVMPYLAENVTLAVQCYNPVAKNPSQLRYTGKRATFVYNTAYNVGANGAQVQEAIMPANFTCNTYRFNVTKPVQGADSPIPTLFLDELWEVTYAPSRN